MSGRQTVVDDEIYAIVRAIPRGRVATYGQIAVLAGVPGRARRVGHALSRVPEARLIPWHRVVNARGAISRRSVDGGPEQTQRLRLLAEGVEFGSRGRIALARFRWRPRPGVITRRH